GNILAIGQTAAHNSAAIDQCSIESERIPGIGAPYVRAHGTTAASGIARVREIGMPVVVFHNRGVFTIWRELERSSVWPAAHKLRGQFLPAARILLAFFVEII